LLRSKPKEDVSLPPLPIHSVQVAIPELIPGPAKFAALKTAEGILSGAQSILSGLGYNTALSALKSYQDSLDLAVQASNAAIAAANSTLTLTIAAQNAAISRATATLESARNSSTEAGAVAAAKKALSDFLAASSTVIASAQSAIDRLADTAEAVAFTAATTTLNFAQNNTADLDLARHALDTVQAAAEVALDVSQWMVEHVGNFFNIELVQMRGTLRGLVDLGEPMQARVKGEVAGNALDYSLEYSVGRTGQLLKRLFERLWADLSAGTIRLPG
jgi:hypothetical protein